MAEQLRETESSRREARAQRILDAAAVLILRWGYNKTTLEDISKQAGVAKGTIYLHWKTREELFEALVGREKLKMSEELRQRVAENPENATLRGILKYSALALIQSPVMKAVLLRDIDILGKMAHSPQRSAAYKERLLSFKAYFEVLREQNLLRTDIDVQAQVYIFSAIFTGFFVIAPFMPDEFALSDEMLVELMVETVHRTLETSLPMPTQTARAISSAFTHHLDGMAQSTPLP